MSWITIVWSMEAAVCLTLGLLYLLVWLKQRRNLAYVLFASMSIGVGCFALFELGMIRAETPAAYSALVRWIHIPAWIVVVSFAWFVRVYLQAGRLWLAWAICLLRTISLALNFYLTPNINFREITGLEHRQWWGGETISIPIGTTNPWTLVGQLSLFLFFIYAIDAAITVWRRGERRRAIVVSSSIVLFVGIGLAQAIVVVWGLSRMPFVISFPFLGLLGVMAYELSSDLLRAASLSDALQESQQRIRLAAEAARLAIWTWEIPENFVWVTDEGRPLYGVSRDEKITWDRFMATLHPEDRAGVQQAIESARRGDGRFVADYRVVLPDESVRWVTALGKTEFGPGHEPLRLRAVSLDVTDQRRAELEAQQNRNELTHLSRVTMLGELSGSLAHELNQPLAAILSNAQAAQRFLDREPLDRRELHEILDDIVTQDQRAGEVIHRLRLLLKKGEVQQQTLDANEVVLDVLKLLRSDLTNQHVVADTDLALELPAIVGDRVQLQQVLVNLVMNACDAMAPVEPRERKVTLRTALATNGQVIIEVEDRGPGISPAGISRVFEPFYSTKANGLGLGLSVCQTIIAAHGGILDARNTSDSGAAFRFVLPIESNGNR